MDMPCTLIEEMYSCRCQQDCLKEYVDCLFPEPFIGNLHARFAIIGSNPGSYGSPIDFKDVKDYSDYYEKHFFESAPEEEWVKSWPKGYLEAYKLLVNHEASLADFNRDAIILNVVKCSTDINWGRLPKWTKEEAKNNCIGYLIQQLENLRPRVILTHGRFACNTIIGLLRDERKYQVEAALSSCNLNTLSGLNMNNLLRNYIIAKNEDRKESLFLFNKHLSFYGSAMYRLKQNLDEKKLLVEKMLSAVL